MTVQPGKQVVTISGLGTFADYYNDIVQLLKDSGCGATLYEGKHPLPIGPIMSFYEKEVSVRAAAYCIASRGI